MPAPPTLVVMDYIVPAIGAVVLVPVLSRIAEPARRTFNAIFVAGACGVSLGGGFSVWEIDRSAVSHAGCVYGTPVVPFIGLAWLMHAAWDLAHTCGEARSGPSCPRPHSVV